MVHTWNLSAGLSGPHPKSVGTDFSYLLVGVITLGSSGQRLPFVKGLCTKGGEETSKKLEEILLEVRAITGENKSVVRFHSDAGKEILNKELKKVLDAKGIFQSSTGGYDPKSNGLAERYIGIIKHLATNLLSHSGLSLTFWYWASMQAAYEYRSRVLGAPLPMNSPTFGDRVLIRDIHGEEKSFVPKAREGIFLHWTMAVTNGAMVALMTDPQNEKKTCAIRSIQA